MPVHDSVTHGDSPGNYPCFTFFKHGLCPGPLGYRAILIFVHVNCITIPVQHMHTKHGEAGKY